MRFLRCTTALLLAFGASFSEAADQNGYVAKYECRAGGAFCNVDIQALTSAACQQTVTTADSNWDKITRNTGSRYFCIEAGDHRAKGPLVLNFSGTATERKVLRYYRSGDDNNEPWAQGSTQAKLIRLELKDARYWLVHRLTVAGTEIGPSVQTAKGTNTTNNIFNRILAEGGGGGTWGIIRLGDLSNNSNVLQNSVVRNGHVEPGDDAGCVDIQGASNLWVVNNEIYNCTKQISVEENAPVPGGVIENNDVYLTTSFYTDCHGNDNPNGPCSKAENGIAFKAGSQTSTQPVLVVQNRIWGLRPSDTAACCGGGAEGQSISMSVGGPAGGTPGTDWMVIQNNIIMDAQHGITGTGYGTATRNNNVSIVGNVLYKFRRYNPSFGSGAFLFENFSKTEVYLNTIIDATGPQGWSSVGPEESNDLRCNAIVASNAKSGAYSTTTQVNNNAYYGTPTSGESSLVSLTVKTATGGTAYQAGDIVRTAAASTCTATTNSACYLYKVVTAGTSAGSTPAYCTSLGCTMTDGSVRLQAIRGPYEFKRRLRTGPESFVIPYARVHSDATEAFACPATYATRTGIGIADD
ncbi:MAG: hypothetical protein HY308_15195 [Gammaproteobacteria bacterium]|nr:hypothetical protein [Gammaproteobacteria bacterium]